MWPFSRQREAVKKPAEAREDLEDRIYQLEKAHRRAMDQLEDLEARYRRVRATKAGVASIQAPQGDLPHVDGGNPKDLIRARARALKFNGRGDS